MSSVEKSNIKLILSVTYTEALENWKDAVSNLLSSKYPDVEINFFHEGKLKERRKAFMLKGGYSAKKSPFAVIFDVDKNPLKAFYSEVEECTIDNIEWYLDFYITQINRMENENSSNQNNN